MSRNLFIYIFKSLWRHESLYVVLFNVLDTATSNPLQMYNVKQTQQEILDLREKLTMQQQRIQLNEQSSEREGKDLVTCKTRNK